jgi:hypothetical protein
MEIFELIYPFFLGYRYDVRVVRWGQKGYQSAIELRSVVEYGVSLTLLAWERLVTWFDLDGACSEI